MSLLSKRLQCEGGEAEKIQGRPQWQVSAVALGFPRTNHRDAFLQELSLHGVHHSQLNILPSEFQDLCVYVCTCACCFCLSSERLLGRVVGSLGGTASGRL